MIKNMPKYGPIEDGDDDTIKELEDIVNGIADKPELTFELKEDLLDVIDKLIAVGDEDEINQLNASKDILNNLYDLNNKINNLADEDISTFDINTTDDHNKNIIDMIKQIDQMLTKGEDYEEDNPFDNSEKMQGTFKYSSEPVKYSYTPYVKLENKYLKLIKDLNLDIDPDDILDGKELINQQFKIPMEKLKGIVPDSWLDEMKEYLVMGDRNEPDYIFGFAMSKDENKNATFHFILYYNDNKWNYKIVHQNNVIHDDETPISLSEVYPDSSNIAYNDLSQKLSYEYYTEPLNMGYIRRNYDNLFKGVERPLLSLDKIGKVEFDSLTKQYTASDFSSGYIYIGNIILDDNEDVRDYIHDYELKPKDNKLEFYVKVGNRKYSNNELVKEKDNILKCFDFNNDVKNHLEIETIDNILFVRI